MPKRKNTNTELHGAKRLARPLQLMSPSQKAMAALRHTRHTSDDGGWLTVIIGSIEAMYRHYTKEQDTATMLTSYACALFAKSKFDVPTRANLYACFMLACKMLDDESPDQQPEMLVLPMHINHVPSRSDVATAEREIVNRLDWNAHLSHDQMVDLLST